MVSNSKSALARYLKYFWFVLVMKPTSLFPDWQFVMKARGFLLKPCFKRCGKNFQICSGATILCSAYMEIGDNVYIAHGVWINAYGGLTLEDNIMLGPYTAVMTTNHSMKDGGYRFGPPCPAEVRIGSGSWTGAGVKILPGVTIGRGVLCAAGAVVTKDMPDYTVVGGVPAKVIAAVDPETGQRKSLNAGG